MKRMPWSLIVTLLLFSIYVQACPHDEEVTILVLPGSLTKINKEAIELDFFDREIMTRRNLSISVDAKTKFRKGKLRITLGDLSPGAICCGHC